MLSKIPIIQNHYIISISISFKLYHNNWLETWFLCMFFSLNVRLTPHCTLNIVHMSLARAESSNILLYLKCCSYNCFSLNILHIILTPCIWVSSAKYPMSYVYSITWHLIFRLHFVLLFRFHLDLQLSNNNLVPWNMRRIRMHNAQCTNEIQKEKKNSFDILIFLPFIWLLLWFCPFLPFIVFSPPYWEFDTFA